MKTFFFALLCLASVFACVVATNIAMHTSSTGDLTGGIIFALINAIGAVRSFHIVCKESRKNFYLSKHTLVALFAGMLCSCEVSHYKAVNATYSGGNLVSYKLVEEPLMQFGGTRSTRRADGSSATNDYQVTARDFFSAVGVAFSTWSYAAQQSAKFAFQKYQAGQITQQQFNSEMNALKLQELKNAGQVVQPGTSVLNNGQLLNAP